MRRFFSRYIGSVLCILALSIAGLAAPAWAKEKAPRNVILFVWDGLRPDSISQKTTPNLWRLSRQGVTFEQNHATYPTFTMMNASSFNTGDFPGQAGFYGNTFWLGRNSLKGNKADGSAFDYKQPVFTEDWQVLDSLNGYYDDHLFLVTRLLEAAQAKGLRTCIVGKSGPAFMFDLKRKGFGIDENMVFPESLASELKSKGYPLPKNSSKMWPGISSGDKPTEAGAKSLLLDKASSDPTVGTTSLFSKANRYLLNVYLEYILPEKRPEVSVIWFRDPDSTEHVYGPGSAAYQDALNSMDSMLGQLTTKLRALGMYQNTDIVVVSDHGHSTVAGSSSLFPLRGIKKGTVATDLDPAHGYSVSGDVRLAQLLADNRITAHVYDGAGCSFDPAMSGILADGTRVYPTKTDGDGSVCGKGAGFQYTTRSFLVPANLEEDAVVIAANGGSDYLYLPGKNAGSVQKIVSFLQSREEFGAIFVDDHYGNIPGTLKMSQVNLENTAGRNPDIIVSYNFDENALVQGMQGTEYESMFGNRGMHGSFSPVDVHNTLIASGPDFMESMQDRIPSGNIDLAPTLAHLLGLNLGRTDGRVLYEALRRSQVSVEATGKKVISSAPAKGLTFYLPSAVLNDQGKVDGGKSVYSIELATSTVEDSTGKSVTYFDYARAVRR